ncbi:MAG: DUF3240 family protein [Sulfuriferula sp.]
MNNTYIQLTLILPVALEEAVLDTLLEHPEWVSGFTSMEVSGHGQSQMMTTAAEEVRGRARRVRVDTVMQRDEAALLLELLKTNWPHPEVVYWMVDVPAFGRFV